MTSDAIEISGICKKYRLFDSALDRLKETFLPFSRRYHREFTALDNISFSVPQGQTLGILGRNGSGKSTLLEIIAGVTKATSGSVLVHGRIAALLELGAGFNPEFTGRQNVVFFAQMMGLTSGQISEHLPEIQSFADIGDFFDQPVRTYSSGMFVRVAFAAATNVNADVILIDEALAVGDAQFQEKCFARLRQFKLQGATIIFVSHSVDAIAALCDRALILDDRRIFADGEPKEIVDRYLRLMLLAPREVTLIATHADNMTDEDGNAAQNDPARHEAYTGDVCSTRPFFNRNEIRISNGGARIIDYSIVNRSKGDEIPMTSGATISLRFKVIFEKDVSRPILGFEIKTISGISITGTNTFLKSTSVNAAFRGDVRTYQFDFRVPLVAGDYFIDLGVAEWNGSPGGRVLEIRRSMINLPIASQGNQRALGLLNLEENFMEISSSRRKDTVATEP